jgi:2-dehydropantoate 2-reductase
MRFVIVGAGALGSILGVHLVRAGHDVTLLLRGRRADEVAASGLRLVGLVSLDAACRVVGDASELATADTLVLATKAIDTERTLGALRHVRVESAFSVQNGVLKDELLAEAFGRERVLGCVADFSGELLPDGRVKFTRNVALHLGELGARPSARVRALCGLLETAGIRSAAADDIVSLEWSKFVGWIAQLPLAVLTRRLTAEFLTDPDAASVIVELAREAKALADAAGVELVDAAPLPVVSIAAGSDDDARALVTSVGERYRATAPEHRMSAQQDALRGSPLELEETLGFALERARALGVPMPALSLAYRVLRAAHPPARARHEPGA